MDAMVVTAPEEGVESELLGQGAATLADPQMNGVANHRPGNPQGIDSVMFIEAGILARQEGVYEIGRNLFNRNDRAVITRQPAIRFAIHVEDNRALRDSLDILDVIKGSPNPINNAAEPRANRPNQQQPDEEFASKRIGFGGSTSSHGTLPNSFGEFRLLQIFISRSM